VKMKLLGEVLGVSFTQKSSVILMLPLNKTVIHYNFCLLFSFFTYLSSLESLVVPTSSQLKIFVHHHYIS